MNAIYQKLMAEILGANGYTITPPKEGGQAANGGQAAANGNAAANGGQANSGNVTLEQLAALLNGAANNNNQSGGGAAASPLTEAGIAAMTPEQLNENWDGVRAYIKENGGLPT